ncbi:MAG: hypothetical protein LBH43_14655 [Treponema sp.]|nr:hypothetical protein [Treponema sp.]
MRLHDFHYDRGLVYVYTMGRGIVYGKYKSGFGYAADIYSDDWHDTFNYN